MSRPSTVFVAWRIDAMMIDPESITVPSKSKRTTGKRIGLMLARERAQTAKRARTARLPWSSAPGSRKST